MFVKGTQIITHLNRNNEMQGNYFAGPYILSKIVGVFLHLILMALIQVPQISLENKVCGVK